MYTAIKIILIIIFIIAILAVALYFIGNVNYAVGCSIRIGQWDAQYNDCEFKGPNILKDNQTWCEKNNGRYEQCGSACRHSPAGINCMATCVQYCAF